MKRFTLIFSFIAALLFGATVSAQFGPPGPPGPGGLKAAAKVTLLTHRDSPVTYDGVNPLAKNEIVLLVLHILGDDETETSSGKTPPFSVARDGSIVPGPGVAGKLIISKDSPWKIQDDFGCFTTPRYTWDTGEYIGVSMCLATVSTDEWPAGKRAFGYAVFLNTKTHPLDSNKDGIADSFGCVGDYAALGVSEYLNDVRIIPLGELLADAGGGVGPGMGPGGIGIPNVTVLLCDRYSNQIKDDLNRCDFMDFTVIRPSDSPVTVAGLPATVAGLTDPVAINKALTPSFVVSRTQADNGGISVTLPAAAKGLMRYTVYTATDLSKPFGEWSLLDEVLKTSDAKKVLANESGMSYTLIRVEDHAVPTIVLPKIGEKRFYRVVGE